MFPVSAVVPVIRYARRRAASGTAQNGDLAKLVEQRLQGQNGRVPWRRNHFQSAFRVRHQYLDRTLKIERPKKGHEDVAKIVLWTGPVVGRFPGGIPVARPVLLTEH